MKPPRPVVCICEVNGIIGLLLRKDYDEASKAHWKNVTDGDGWWDPCRSDGYNGDLLHIPDGLVFRFKKRSPEHLAFAEGNLFLERATFYVPETCYQALPDPKKEFERAQLHFYGKVLISTQN